MFIPIGVSLVLFILFRGLIVFIPIDFNSGKILSAIILHVLVVIIPLLKLIFGKISYSKFLTQIAITLGFIYLAIAIPITLYHLTPNTGIFRRLLDRLVLRIPILGLAVRENSISRYCKGFHMLYKAGVPIAQCAAQAHELTGNTIIADIFKGGAASAEFGNMAYEGFSRKFPLDYLNIWKTGEETGELDKMSAKIAEISGDKAELLFTEFAKWLPRFIYAIICLIMIIRILSMAGAIRSSYTP